MKSLLFVLMGVLLISSVAGAAEIISDDSTAGTAVDWHGSRSQYFLTQNTAPIVLGAGTFTCGNVTLGYVTEGWAMRRFSPYWEIGAQAITVSSIDWGVRRFVSLLNGTAGSIPNPITVEVLLYTIPHNSALTFAAMGSPIAIATELITPADNPIPPLLGTWKHTPIVGTYDPMGGDMDLVVAIHYPEGYSTTPTTRFVASSSTTGETAESYYAFADCGFPEPVTPTELGSPGTSQLVLIVNYDMSAPGACCDPNGDCTVEIQTDCSLPRVWNGASSCDANPCPQPGACCDPSGACSVEVPVTCVAPRAWYGGDSCSPNPCPVPAPGACCDPSGACTIEMQTTCLGPRAWNGATSCQPNPCPLPPCTGELHMNFAGSAETGIAWQQGGSFPPFYGAFAECVDVGAGGGNICGIRLMLSSIGSPCQPLELYIWDDYGGHPNNVIQNSWFVDPCPVATYPDFSTHDIALNVPVPVTGVVWVGYMADFSAQDAGYYVAADLDGPGGCPQTNIAPGIGFSTGWNNVSEVWGPTQSLGIGAWVSPALGACCNPWAGGCRITEEADCGAVWQGPHTDCSPNPCSRAPFLLSVTDIPNDQGREVRLRWVRAQWDAANQEGTVTGYAVFRKQGENKAGDPSASADRAGDGPVAADLRVDGWWDYILTVPACGDSVYQCAAPTLCDSTISGGPCRSTFMIRARTANLYEYYDSDSLGGFSVDNIAPAAPTNLHFQGPAFLAWNDAAEADFNFYSVYGSWDPVFNRQAAYRIGYTTTPEMNVAGSPYLYFYVATTDVAGNEGQAAGIQNVTAGAATLLSVVDVGNDQGRQVRLRWRRGAGDAPNHDPRITGYLVLRQQMESKAEAPLTSQNQAGDTLAAADLRLDGWWDYILTVPAVGDSVYQCVAPTLCDSTFSGGLCLSTFKVRATTTDPFTIWESAPLSGYSVDNLAPAPPANLHFQRFATLVWSRAGEADFAFYSVYGSPGPIFDRQAAVLLGHPTIPAMDVAGNQHPYLHVTTTDLAGNEGPAAGIQNATSGVESALPGALRLQVLTTPNPSAAGVVIRCLLPLGSRATLSLFDASGRMVRRLHDGDLPAGETPLSWDGRDDAGREVPAGVYLVKMFTPAGETNARVVLTR